MNKLCSHGYIKELKETCIKCHPENYCPHGFILELSKMCNDCYPRNVCYHKNLCDCDEYSKIRRKFYEQFNLK
jgi:hypothetical protein